MDKNIAALLREDAYTVGVSFDGNGKIYTYVTDIPGIRVDDLVVVPNAGMGRGGEYEEFKMVRVCRVDDDVDVAPNSEIQVKWLVSRVDLAYHEANMAKNKAIEQTIGATYKANLRAAFRNEVLRFASAAGNTQMAELLGVKAPPAQAAAEPVVTVDLAPPGVAPASGSAAPSGAPWATRK